MAIKISGKFGGGKPGTAIGTLIGIAGNHGGRNPPYKLPEEIEIRNKKREATIGIAIGISKGITDNVGGAKPLGIRKPAWEWPWENP